MALPDQELAPFRDFPPDVLRVHSSDDEDRARLKKLTLMLALVFNDLKDLTWYEQQVRSDQLPKDEISPRVGQRNGMKITIERWAFGIVWEFFLLVEEYAPILGGKTVLKCVKRMPREAQAAWNELFRIATKQPGHDRAVRNLYARIRSELAFHYWDNVDALHGGYVEHFASAPGAPQTSHAKVSLGRNMEGTRFYFADAAAGMLMRRWILRPSVDLGVVNQMGRYINVALRALVEELLLHLERSLSRP